MPRGGRRPGAGAPKGNLNALKHGRRSRQFAELGAMIAASPKLRATLLAIADRHERRDEKADEIATRIISSVIKRGLAVGRDRQGRGGLFVLPPIDERRTIEENAPPQARPKHRRRRIREKSGAHNQTSGSRSSVQSDTRYENRPD